MTISVGAQNVPPTPPTSMGPIAATPSSGGTLPHHRARVTYAGNLLQVRADNSSLNQILRDISRQTGMKIIGGVADQRIFGSYGPAAPATVLETLLDGTGVNMLLQESADHAPEQLVLTPRTGGATPPGPGSQTYDITETEPELPLPPNAQPGSPPVANPAAPNPAPANNNVLGNPNNVSPTASTLPVTNSVPLSTLATPSTAAPVSGIVDAPNPPPAGSTTAGFTNQTTPANPNTAPPATANPAPPNGVKTPEQIYQELKRLEQQKANPQGSSAPQ